MKFEREATRLHAKLEKENVDGKIKFYKRREVYPIFNEDGQINWFNFLTGGSWKNLIYTIILIAIIIGMIFEYHQNLEVCAEIISTQIQSVDLPINLPAVNFTSENSLTKILGGSNSKIER